MTREYKWDYELLGKLSKLVNPNMPKNFYTRRAISDGRNCPARVIQNNVKMLLKNLPAETFIK